MSPQYPLQDKTLRRQTRRCEDGEGDWTAISLTTLTENHPGLENGFEKPRF